MNALTLALQGNQNTDYLSPTIDAMAAGNYNLTQQPDALTMALGGNSATGLPGYQAPNTTLGMSDYFSMGSDLVGGLAGLGNVALGLKNYNLGKDAFDESKRQFDLNYGNQVKTTNANLADRQATRIAGAGSGASRLPSVQEYMQKNGL